MRPRWLARRRRPSGEVTVTLELDTSALVAALARAKADVDELEAIGRHRRRIAHERSQAQAQVGDLLDRLCLSYGWDPVHVWRAPREREEQDRRDQARLRAAWWAGAAIPHTMLGGGA